MRHLIFTFLIFSTLVCSSQKYALLDKQMGQPVTFTNTVTLQNSFAGFFPVEKDKLVEFVAAIEKIAKQLIDSKKVKPEAFKFTIGTITFTGLKIELKDEDRLDVVLSSQTGQVKTTMHLCDAKISNINNAFFVNTWAKYIRSYMGSAGTR